MENNKKYLRKAALTERNQLSLQEREVQSHANTKMLLQDKRYKEADVLLVFASYGSEADTFELFRHALLDGKEVYFPKVISNGDTEKMVFFQVRNESELVPGYKGIPEPDGNSVPWKPDAGKKCLMIMPGAAFDRERNRIGYGKGFYDRFLFQYPELQQQTIAIGYSCQLVSNIVADEYDYKPSDILLSGRWIGDYHD